MNTSLAPAPCPPVRPQPEVGSGITCSNKWGLQGHSERVALIAIIDAHIAFRAQVGRALMSLYRVKGFPDEVEAIREMRLEPPSVILIDEMIGPRGGCELIHASPCVGQWNPADLH